MSFYYMEQRNAGVFPLSLDTAKKLELCFSPTAPIDYSHKSDEYRIGKDAVWDETRKRIGHAERHNRAPHERTIIVVVEDRDMMIKPGSRVSFYKKPFINERLAIRLNVLEVEPNGYFSYGGWQWYNIAGKLNCCFGSDFELVGSGV